MHMRRQMLVAVSIALVGAPFVATVVLAQQAPPAAGPKLYRWVSPDGKVHYSDDLPPEALTQARSELSKSTGMTLKQVDRALTSDELAAAQAKADADAKVAQALDKVKQNDQALLSSYPSEDELKRAYDERLSMQVEGLKTTRMGLDSQQKSLASFLFAASNMELSGKPVATQLATSIQSLHTQIIAQQQSETQIEAQLTNLRQEGDSTLAHYRELRAAALAAHSDAPASAASSKQ